MLVPQLRAELDVRTSAARGPGRAWAVGPAREAAVAEAGVKPNRVGYARCSTVQQELQSQLDALHQAGRDPIFSEKISTCVKVRPEFSKTMDFARTIKMAVPHQRVIFTVHEMKRLGRGAAELLTIAEELRRADIQLELLTGPLQGVYDPSGHGAALFAFPTAPRADPNWRHPIWMMLLPRVAPPARSAMAVSTSASSYSAVISMPIVPFPTSSSARRALSASRSGWVWLSRLLL
jgi:hypothetical protein